MKLRQIKSIAREKQLCLRKFHVISTLHDRNYFVALEENRTYSLPVLLTAFKITSQRKRMSQTFTLCGFLPAFCNYRIFYFQITNLMHNSFILQQYVCYTTILNMFRAARCSSSGGPIVSPQPLVSSPSVSSRTVCCILYGCL